MIFANSKVQHPDLKVINVLMWPLDASIIASLSLEEKIVWYSGQDPRYLVYLAQDPSFKRFWARHYLAPLHFKRWMYRTKNAFKRFFAFDS